MNCPLEINTDVTNHLQLTDNESQIQMKFYRVFYFHIFETTRPFFQLPKPIAYCVQRKKGPRLKDGPDSHANFIMSAAVVVVVRYFLSSNNRKTTL